MTHESIPANQPDTSTPSDEENAFTALRNQDTQP
jgi:hypothetical protein